MTHTRGLSNLALNNVKMPHVKLGESGLGIGFIRRIYFILKEIYNTKKNLTIIVSVVGKRIAGMLVSLAVCG